MSDGKLDQDALDRVLPDGIPTTTAGLARMVGRIYVDLQLKIHALDSKVDALDSKVDALDSKVDAQGRKVDALATETRQGFAKLGRKMDRVHDRLHTVEGKVDELGIRVDGLGARVQTARVHYPSTSKF